MRSRPNVESQPVQLPIRASGVQPGSFGLQRHESRFGTGAGVGRMEAKVGLGDGAELTGASVVDSNGACDGSMVTHRAT